jgi:histidinol-phosphate aminotransferase
MDIRKVVRQNILNVTPYIAGKPIEETKRQLGLKEVIKLASNENPLGPSPRALAAIRACLSGINRYPDSSGFYLKRKLAKTLQLEPSCLALGNGSDELISTIIQTFVEDDESILTADTTFLEYEIIAKVHNRTVVTVPLRYFKYDLEAMKKKIDAKTKVVFIANPNNPTGTYVTKYELEDFLMSLPGHVVLVLDEAYDAFIDVNDFPKTTGYLNNRNIMILKTFSKAYGLAGVRIGYCIADPDLISFMERSRQPFNVNMLAQAAAGAALDDKKFLSKSRQVVLEGKRYLYDALKKMGIAYVPSVSNFILIDVGKDGLGVFKDMLKHGVIVRDMKQYGLKNFIRVTIGTKRENERFVAILKKVL